MNTLEEIRKLVEEECKKDTNIFGDEIWTYHILSVVEYAKLLAKKLNADKEIVEIAALLHDYAGIKDRNKYENHHMLSADEAEKILTQFKYPQEKIEKIKHCIQAHRGSKSIKRESARAQSKEKLWKPNVSQVPMQWHTLIGYLPFFILYFLGLE